ncbi:MAG: GTP-binding protein [Candidatus Hermodarchaeota archaeon]
MAEEYDYLFKSIVVGDGGVGKTALTLRFSKGFFTEDYKMTIGVDFHVKTISIDTSEGTIKCKLQLWDTGGQERFSSIRPMYYRGSLGAVLVFDLTNYASFEHLPQWIEEVRANIKSEIPLLLVGNKNDLTDQRTVSIEEINKFTRDFNLYYMETSAKTGDGVGDCFYILACLMIGSGVPEQLIKNQTVFSPGRITLEVSPVLLKDVSPPEPEIDYAAPPVPEPPSIKSPEPSPIFESEPEIDYAAPPVPEPPSIKSPEPSPLFESEPEIDYTAPPVPERPSEKSIEPAPKYELEPEIETPELSEIEFKTPEEILAEKSNETQQVSAFDKILEITEPDSYKPKVVPFSDATPTPAPRPEGFPAIEGSTAQKKETNVIPPFRVTKQEEPPKPKPASMTFEQPPEKIPITPMESPIFPSSLQSSQKSSSQSLVDYMPQTILSKKEKKKLAKEKKKKEKEKKLQMEREKQEKLIEGMKKTKKEKKEKKPEVSETASLFQTLTRRTEGITGETSTTVLPFVATKKIEAEETSKLRIIPNVDDIEPSGFMQITPPASKQKKETTQELLICRQCGATLSADYAYCNKCGAKL